MRLHVLVDIDEVHGDPQTNKPRTQKFAQTKWGARNFLDRFDAPKSSACRFGPISDVHILHFLLKIQQTVRSITNQKKDGQQK